MEAQGKIIQKGPKEKRKWGKKKWKIVRGVRRNAPKGGKPSLGEIEKAKGLRGEKIKALRGEGGKEGIGSGIPVMGKNDFEG